MNAVVGRVSFLSRRCVKASPIHNLYSNPLNARIHFSIAPVIRSLSSRAPEEVIASNLSESATRCLSNAVFAVSNAEFELDPDLGWMTEERRGCERIRLESGYNEKRECWKQVPRQMPKTDTHLDRRCGQRVERAFGR